MELKVLPCRACAETGMRELVVHEVETILRPEQGGAMHMIVCHGTAPGTDPRDTHLICFAACKDRHASFEAAVEQWNAAQGGR